MIARNTKYDLVIIGSGLSGAAAAAQAGLKGIKTLVVEKRNKTGGSGNYVEGVFAVNSEIQRQNEVYLSQEQILDEEKSWTHGLADMAIWRNYVFESAHNIEWLKNNGVKITRLRTLGIGENTWHLFEGKGESAINNGLLPVAKSCGVEIITSAKVVNLIKNENGDIRGIIIENLATNEQQFIAARNVILATGGYLNNQELLNTNNNHNGKRIIPVNCGSNTGDGLKLAWEIGAKKYGMGVVMMFGGQVFDPTIAGYKNWMRQINRAATHEANLWVNEEGNRFANEDCNDLWSIAGNTIIRQQKVYSIYNQKQINDLVKQAFKGTYNYDHLKDDIREDLEINKPYLTKANNIDELGKKLHLSNLAASINRYNELVNANLDSDFGKKEKFLHKIDDQEIYAIELGVGAFCTLGGLRTDTENRVLDNSGELIQGLYAIGSDGSSCLVGDTYNVNIPGSEAGYCIYSGRNAVMSLID